jgi:4-alpha-glucanotransferase
VTVPTPALVDLAVACGVATEYWDWQGRHVVVASETVSAVLAALGVGASTPDRAEAALAEQRLNRWRRTLPPTLVMREGWTPWFAVHLPHGSYAEVWVELEDGGQRRDVPQQDNWVDPQWVDGALVGEATYQLPGDLPLGYHKLRARTEREVAECTLIVTPHRLRPRTDRRSWGWVLQLYSVRSRASWGTGDLGDLSDLAAWSGHELGTGFVLVNPLHAAEASGRMEPSPYLPSSRRFGNPLYLRVEAIDEYAELKGDQRQRVRTLAGRARKLNQDAAALDRDRAWALKREALELLFDVPPSIGRAAEYAAFKRREGQGLTDFATWCAIADLHGSNWHKWSSELADPASDKVVAFRKDHPRLVEFHSWLQWQLDCQLARTQSRALAAGMPVGVMHDLAVGVNPDGADAWALQRVLAGNIQVGAPPDAFNQQGQNWSQPPWRPDQLAETGYAAWRDLVRSVVRHAGGLRIDHVLGLFRLWWIAGDRPTDGTYVRYDHEALIGILVLEAARAGVVVVGEDLGTVEPWVRDHLAERGVLGTSVLWFERRWEDGTPLAPERWRELCLATVTTHDLPPTAGYLSGDHVALRDRLGLLTRSLDEELAVDAAERGDWLRVLRDRRLLGEDDADLERIVAALHRYVAHTPALLVGVSLTDAVGERRTQNQPGTTDEYPNWRIPLGGPAGEVVLLDDLPHNQHLLRLVGALSV